MLTEVFCSSSATASMTAVVTALLLILLLVSVPPAHGAGPMGDAPWYDMPEGDVQTRWYTFENPQALPGGGGKANHGRKGAPACGLAAGKSLTVADIRGSGTIRRIWMTFWKRNPKALRGIKIEMYWDGAKTPAVEAPLGDFFCHSLGHMVAFENVAFASPEGRSFDCFVPMPFHESARIVLVNESGEDNGVYYDVACTLGDPHGDDVLYFHAYWRRENYTQLRRDMTILPRIEGRGRFLGCNLGVRLHPSCTRFWWGEGEVKVYLDGDKGYPTLCGTGTEDYIGDGYGQGLFDHLYQGNQFVGDNKEAYGFYRFHVPDPVYFHRDIRVTIQVMGGPSYKLMLDALDKDPSLRFMKAGDGTQYYTREELEARPGHAEVMERIDDHCATAYWYQDRPVHDLAPLSEQAPATERMKDLP